MQQQRDTQRTIEKLGEIGSFVRLNSASLTPRASVRWVSHLIRNSTDYKCNAGGARRNNRGILEQESRSLRVGDFNHCAGRRF
jgi:hypothetical protein